MDRARPRRCGLRGLWMALACAFAAPAMAACNGLVATGNPEYPPYLWRATPEGNRLVGANAELMQLLSKEIGLPIEVRYVGTWARVQEEARVGRVDLIAGAFFTLPRLDYMDYVYPAFHVTRSVVWMRQSQPFDYQRWQDLQGKSGLSVINNSFGEEFDRYAKEALRISTVASLEQALRMVERGRADYLIYEEGPAQAYIARLNVPGLTAEPTAISNEGLYLTLSHKSACNTPELRARLAKAMYRFERQNVMKKLVEAGVQAWRTQK
ncbi:substrate-binding periplasmic protein [Pseudorhodoferax sp.]|uniref:substrate-binding periplasmic protein n=1 Tax=Pseudorhodoferax sp. TaxID=1993553 RepID=UPI002DD667D9|nr:transporter substrate-binding domain-containing protein [Pseudorhodoferax sp.]